jgi:hypothetical protein
VSNRGLGYRRQPFLDDRRGVPSARAIPRPARPVGPLRGDR